MTFFFLEDYLTIEPTTFLLRLDVVYGVEGEII